VVFEYVILCFPLFIFFTKDDVLFTILSIIKLLVEDLISVLRGQPMFVNYY
jgi:hypothetical protein